MWAEKSVFYQIYPLGFCGAPQNNNGQIVSRIQKVTEWIEHIKACGCDAIYFSPLFESDSHGYDTRDYTKLDCRLGTNADFSVVCEKLHKNGIKIVLDGVFNHVGRGFWAFQDVLKNRENSPYKDWFQINFDGNSNYNDGLWYEGWEGHYELVKLNLRNEEVIQYILGCIKGWITEFDIDGLRLDVAYCLDHDFLHRLRAYCDGLKQDFFFIGEILGGDYNQIMNDQMLHSVTNYECYKGFYSSFNSMNFFEIAHSLLRQFGPDDWSLYKGKHLFNFVDKHDVARISTLLSNKKHLPLIYAMLFAVPGIPCIYYGSEWGAEGAKNPGSDASLRPCFENPEFNELTKLISACANAHKNSQALCYGNFMSLLLTNRQFIFERTYGNERVLVAINADSVPFFANFNANAGRARDLLTGQIHDFGGGSELPPYSVQYWEIY